MNADYIELQGKIDQAVKDNSTVEVTRNYVIDEQLRVERFEDGEYKFHSAKIVGNATMWDVGNGNIIAEFNDKPIVNVQCSKGGIFRGLNIRGTGPNGIDERYNVYSAFSIDGNKSESRSGSTGVRVEDCTFNEVNVGAITSMNGWTQNAEMLTFQNIRIGRVKYGIVGCQAQEKMNRVINIGCWEKCDTLFMFNKYGQGTPGHWIIDGVNVAGEVDYLVHRDSHEWFPLVMSNVCAEELIGIGHWFSYLSDRLDNVKIDFRFPDENSPLPKSHLDGGVIVSNSTIRYNGRPELPIVLTPTKDRGIEEINVTYSGRVVRPYYVPDEVEIIGKQLVDSDHVKGVRKDDVILFFNPDNNGYEGVAVGKGRNEIEFSSLTNNKEYLIGKLN